MIENTLFLFENYRDHKKASAMEAYMKNKFSFFGISSPQRIELGKKLTRDYGIFKLNKQWVNDLWSGKERELQYVAMDHLKKYIKQLNPEDFEWIKDLIVTKSWWDTVDFLATHAVGYICKICPALIPQKMESWIHSDNIWLIRSAILFQLKYKQNTDFELLKRYILTHDQSKEFFINKAAGWALREYAKTDPVSVKQFVNATPELSNLTKREALKHFNV